MMPCGRDGGVVEEDVEVVLRDEEGGDVGVRDEIRLRGPLDRLLDLEVGGVREFADLLTDRPLPGGQPVDKGVEVRVGVPRSASPCHGLADAFGWTRVIVARPRHGCWAR
jgi:hypothetical protein